MCELAEGTRSRERLKQKAAEWLSGKALLTVKWLKRKKEERKDCGGEGYL